MKTAASGGRHLWLRRRHNVLAFMWDVVVFMFGMAVLICYGYYVLHACFQAWPIPGV
jgi:hypothetical protein